MRFGYGTIKVVSGGSGGGAGLTEAEKKEILAMKTQLNELTSSVSEMDKTIETNDEATWQVLGINKPAGNYTDPSIVEQIANAKAAAIDTGDDVKTYATYNDMIKANSYTDEQGRIIPQGHEGILYIVTEYGTSYHWVGRQAGVEDGFAPVASSLIAKNEVGEDAVMTPAQPEDILYGVEI